MKGEALERFISLLFPRGCVLCGKTVAYDDLLCGTCSPDRPTCKLCLRCGKPHSSCVCPGPDEGWAFSGVVSALPYRGGTRDAILRLKKTPDARICKFFAGEMAGALRDRLPDAAFDIIAETPMHPDKLARRGFNHAELLAAQVAAELRIPHRMRLLACTGAEGQQHNLNREQRFAAVRDRYELRAGGAKGKAVLLVDDVLTTGATAHACARRLLDGGAKSVYVLTAAGTDKI